MDPPAANPTPNKEDDDDEGPTVSGPASDERTISNPLFGKKIPPTKKS